MHHFLSLLLLSFFTTGSAFASFDSYPDTTQDVGSTFVTHFDTYPETVQDVCSTCVTQFENLYFNPKSSAFLTLGENIDLDKSIYLEDKRGYIWKNRNRETFPSKREQKTFGSSLIVLESNSTPNHSNHYFHFLEHLLALWTFGGEENREQIDLFLLASNGSTPPKNWKGTNDITYHLIKAAFPNAEILAWKEFMAVSPEHLIRFETALVSDRSMEIFKTEPYRTDRMLGSYFQSLTKESLDHLATCVYDYFQTEITPTDELVVTYIPRFEKRWLQPECEEQLLAQIRELPNVRLQVIDLAAIPFEEQIQVIANTDVLLGVHGNGFSNVLFLPSHATVIELFPEKSFRVEYRILAKARELAYWGWIDQRGWMGDRAVERTGCFGVVRHIYGTVKVEVDPIVSVIRQIKKPAL